MKKIKKGFYERIAWLLPEKLLYYCVIRAMAIATTGKWSNQEAPSITSIEVLKRLNKD